MYAKFISETQINTTIPKRGYDAQGRLVTGGLINRPDVLAILGYYPLVEEDMPSEHMEGYHYEKRYYPKNENNEIVQYWISVEDPPEPEPAPRTFSKYKLKLEIAKVGLLDQFMQLLESVEVVPGYSGAAAFNDALTLDEDNEKFKDAVRFAKSELGLTDEDVERILSASVSELG